MKPDEVESQLSAMFDGELPAAECELLSRRIDRDERLRARWARYVLIGASMRYEPVATASPEFATRVSAGLAAALEREAAVPAAATKPTTRLLRAPSLVWQSALAAALVVAVAGLSITLLRDTALNTTASSPSPARSATDQGAAEQLAGALQRRFAPTEATTAGAGALSTAEQTPWSYVTPSGNERSGSPLRLRSELADYIVAHSDYSTPLMRSDLLSALVSGEQGLDDTSVAGGASSSAVAASSPDTGEIDAATAASPTRP